MSSLKELQESFQRGILAGDDTVLAEIKDSPKEERKVLFGVYRNAYVARLAEVLADDYEQVHAYLGDAVSPGWPSPTSPPTRRIGEALGTSGATFRIS